MAGTVFLPGVTSLSKSLQMYSHPLCRNHLGTAFRDGCAARWITPNWHNRTHCVTLLFPSLCWQRYITGRSNWLPLHEGDSDDQKVELFLTSVVAEVRIFFWMPVWRKTKKKPHTNFSLPAQDSSDKQQLPWPEENGHFEPFALTSIKCTAFSNPVTLPRISTFSPLVTHRWPV